MDLLAAIGEACEKCDGCNVELLCNLMKVAIRPEGSIPPEVLAEAGADPDCKLACEVDPESGAIHAVEADYRYDLTDVPSTLLTNGLIQYLDWFAMCLNLVGPVSPEAPIRWIFRMLESCKQKSSPKMRKF